MYDVYSRRCFASIVDLLFYSFKTNSLCGRVIEITSDVKKLCVQFYKQTTKQYNYIYLQVKSTLYFFFREHFVKSIKFYIESLLNLTFFREKFVKSIKFNIESLSILNYFV